MIIVFAVLLILAAGVLFWYTTYREDRRRTAEERVENPGSAHGGDD